MVLYLKYESILLGREVTGMKKAVIKSRAIPARETLTEAYEVRAFRDESEEPKVMAEKAPDVQHATEQRAFERVKKLTRGHGEQTVLPDDCQFGDNDLCYVDA
jgi:hypothetical protein